MKIHVLIFITILLSLNSVDSQNLSTFENDPVYHSFVSAFINDDYFLGGNQRILARSEEFQIDSITIRGGTHSDQRSIYIYNDAYLLAEKQIKLNENGNFVLRGRDAYTYDENLNMTERLTQYLNDTGWENSWRRIYAYENGLRSRFAAQYWWEGQWADTYDNLYYYDAEGKLIEYVFRRFRDSTWMDDRKEKYFYNNVGLMDSLMKWHVIYDTTWKLYHLDLFHYSLSGKITQQKEYSRHDSTWQQSGQKDYVYDSLDRLIRYSKIHIAWDTLITYRTRYDYYYDEFDNIINKIEYFGEDTTWNLGRKHEMEYDDYNNKLSEYEYNYNVSDSTWKYHVFNEYYHNYLTDFSYVKAYIWDSGEWIPFPDFRLSFNMFGYVVVKDIQARYVECFYSGLLASDKENPTLDINHPDILCYPNPTRDKVSISMNLNQSDRMNISLLSLNGSIIRKLFNGYADQGLFTREFKLPKLCDGTYMIVASHGSEKFVSRLAIIN